MNPVVGHFFCFSYLCKEQKVSLFHFFSFPCFDFVEVGWL